jgi:hypothetical protein
MRQDIPESLVNYLHFIYNHVCSICPLTLGGGGGIHTLSHTGETIGLQRCIVSVPAENFISAQQFPNKACKVSNKLNTFHICIP